MKTTLLILSLRVLQCRQVSAPRPPLYCPWVQGISPLATTVSSPKRRSFSTRFKLKMLLRDRGPCCPPAMGKGQG